jgi:hypothetical protein
VAERLISKTSASMQSSSSVGSLLAQHFRCVEELAEFFPDGDLSGASGYFRMGDAITCFGRCSSGAVARDVSKSLHDVWPQVGVNGTGVHLPFDPVQVIDNLRCERYAREASSEKTVSGRSGVRMAYYLLRPLLSLPLRKQLQRLYFRGWQNVPFPSWPVDRTVESLLERLLVLSMRSQGLRRLPFIWFWPDGAPSCTILTHDVESAAGVDFTPRLMDLDDSFGIKASFQVVPEERYEVRRSYLAMIKDRGFELNVHDLNHDGQLMSSRQEFFQRVGRINDYGREFGAKGFRSAVLYRNADWLRALDFSYDMSIPNVAHLDPQRGGCCTVFPYFIGPLLELPVTTIQDHSLLHILNDFSIGIWRQQIELIQEAHGLVSIIVHPDYVVRERARTVYTDLLRYLVDQRSEGRTWIALAGEAAAWWRLRGQLHLAQEQGEWQVKGEGSERARIAYAVLTDDRLKYEISTA